MSKVCGVSISGSEAVFTILEGSREEFAIIDSTFKKIGIGDDKDQDQIKSFYRTIEDFLKQNNISDVFVKKTSSAGQFKAGAISFKIEALLQLQSSNVKLVSPASIAALLKKGNIPQENIDNVYKYQVDSLKVAFYGLG